MKKLLALLLTGVLLVGMVGCSSSSSDTSDTADTADTADDATEEDSTEKETLVIAWAFKHLDEAMTRWWNSVQVATEEYNAGDNPYYIETLFTNSENDNTTLITDVETLIVQNPDVILIQAVDSEGSVPAFEACTAAGIPVVDLGQNVSYEDDNMILFTNMDHYYCGVLQAEWLNTYLDENPDEYLYIGYLQGSAGVTDMDVRYEGFVDTLDSDRAEVLSMQNADFDAALSLSITEDWIQAFPEMNCLVSSNDEMCVGGLQAMKSANISVLALGMDGGDNAIQEIADGYMSATIGFDFELTGQISFEMAVAIASGTNTLDEWDVSEDVIYIVDEDNAADYLD